MAQYILGIPRLDSFLPWHRVKVFNSKSDAVKYSDDKLRTDNAWCCIVDTIRPN